MPEADPIDPSGSGAIAPRRRGTTSTPRLDDPGGSGRPGPRARLGIRHAGDRMARVHDPGGAAGPDSAASTGGGERHPATVIVGQPGPASRRAPARSRRTGTAASARDLLSRMVWGARASLLIGVALGAARPGARRRCSAWWPATSGAASTPCSRGAFDALLSFPQLILALTLVTVFASQEGVSATRRMVVLIFALGIVSIPVLARITRANTLAWSPTRVRPGRPGARGQEPPDHVRARCCPTSCRPCSPSPCWAWRWSSWPRAA